MRRFCLLLAATALTMLLLSLASRDEAAQTKEEPKQPAAKPAEAKGGSRPILTLDAGGHTSLVMRVYFTPDSRRVVTFSNDGTIRVWDVQTGETRKVFYPPGTMYPLMSALSPNGKRLAVSSEFFKNGKKVFKVLVISLTQDRLERVLSAPFAGHPALAFSHDGKRLATGDRAIRLWDLEKNGPEPEKVIASKSHVAALVFAPDGLRLGVNGESAGVVELTTGKEQTFFKNAPGQTWLDWSKDGQTLAFVSTSGARVWEATGKLKAILDPKADIESTSFSPNSNRVLSVTSQPARAILFDLATGKPLRTFTGGERFHHGVLSPNGKVVAAAGRTAGTHEIFLWNADSGALIKRLTGRTWLNPPLEVAWSADGKSVAWKPNAPSFHLTKLQFGPPLAGKDARRRVFNSGPMSITYLDGKGVRLLKDGKHFAALSRNYQVVQATFAGKDKVATVGDGFYIYDANNGKFLRQNYAHSTAINSIAPSPDGRLLATVSWDQKLSISSPDSSYPLLSIFSSGKDWIMWTEEGYYAGTPGGERFMGWKVSNGNDQLMTFYPADRFRKLLYRPDAIKLVLEKGNVTEAVKTADTARGIETRNVKIQELLPPRAVLTVLDQSKLPTVKLKVKADAASKDQPITALRLLIDGRPVPGKETLVEFREGKTQADVEWTFELPEGEHQLSVLSRGPDSSSVSPAIRLKHIDVGKLPVLHVLTVGINEYKDNSLDLKYAAPDAQALAEAFAKNCKGQPFRAVTTRTLLNRQGTTKAILQELAALRKQVDQQDLVIVFFACHGVKHKKDYFLLTHETNMDDLAKTALSGAALREALGEFKCQVLLLLDACHSAGFGQGQKLAQMGLKPATDDVTRDLTEDEYGVAVMCAAMGQEKAEGQGGHGLFTQSILDALEKKPGVPFNPFNQRVYVHHLYSYVFDHVSHQSQERQHPCLNLPWIVESFVVR